VRKGEAAVTITRYEREEIRGTDDVVVIEKPLEIYVNDNLYYVAMRMPGEEIQLALGYCFSEGIIDSIDDVLLAQHCGEKNGNRVESTLDEKRPAGKGLSIMQKVLLPAYSSCGICGKETIADIYTHLNRRKASFSMSVSRIDDMIRMVEARQIIFGKTGGTHATGIFNKDCELLALSEDIGRHNALDKAIGELIAKGRVKEAMVVVTTSRLSYEMVQKAGCGNAQVLVGISIATSLAIDLAESINLTLVGFARKRRGKIYTGSERVTVG
jgi:FdhD protein